MRKYILTLAAAAAVGLSGVAFADEATKGPAPLTDSELEEVTAAGEPNVPGIGVFTAFQAAGQIVNLNGLEGTQNARDNGGVGQNGNIPGTLGLTEPALGTISAGQF